MHFLYVQIKSFNTDMRLHLGGCFCHYKILYLNMILTGFSEDFDFLKNEFNTALYLIVYYFLIILLEPSSKHNVYIAHFIRHRKQV